MRTSKLLTAAVLAASLARLSFGCSSSSSSSSSCSIPTGACHDCAVNACGASATAAFGAKWQNLDFSGGSCADLLSCQCGCGGDPSCITTCTENASGACKSAEQKLQSCLDGACSGCRAFAVAPQPNVPDAGPSDAPLFDTAIFDSGVDSGSTDSGATSDVRSCSPEGTPCLADGECCSNKCAGSFCAA